MLALVRQAIGAMFAISSIELLRELSLRHHSRALMNGIAQRLLRYQTRVVLPHRCHGRSCRRYWPIFHAALLRRTRTAVFRDVPVIQCFTLRLHGHLINKWLAIKMMRIHMTTHLRK
ncbi:hypothetical protein C9I28_14695 [Pseudoduganella armeniaca]|uniref:Uncharacterized protein n=1 Tax=Pseudoduganella armeniaca TaxID=2072590 RepID=A0A2R4CB00_9BURK|nr:hypothetical protein C9I28_14695 [Pseudoduganella armeniaca]